jgi:hypothetical protein
MDQALIAQLRGEARASSGGGYIRLDEPGDWFAGYVDGHQTVSTEYGPTEELILHDVTLNDEEIDGQLTFRLSRSVLSRELGSDAEKAPSEGWLVFVTYRGQRQGKSGRAYHAYDINKKKGAPEDAPKPKKGWWQRAFSGGDE